MSWAKNCFKWKSWHLAVSSPMHLHHVFVSWRISFGLHRKCCSHKWNRFSNHLQARCYSMGLWSCLNFFETKNIVPYKLLSFWLQFIRLFIFDEMNELETVEDQHLLLPSMLNSWFLIERILLKNEMIPFVKEMQFLMDDHDHLNIAIAFTTQIILNFEFFYTSIFCLACLKRKITAKQVMACSIFIKFLT